MGLYSWCCRCIPGISIVLWIFVTYMALGGRIGTIKADPSQDAYDWKHLTAWQIIYIVHSVFAHLCACIFFPVRLCWAVWHLKDEMRTAKFDASQIATPYTDSESATSLDDKSSHLSSSHASLSPVSPVENPLSRLGTPKSSVYGDSNAYDEEVTHAIIIPDYKEDIDTMRETLAVLASHVMAKACYDVYLAMEQRDPDAKSVANQLITEFGKSFFRLSFTLHPGDIPGEVAGKSSNVSWAGRELSHKYTDLESRRNCVITVMDSDTHLSSDYFCLLTKFHREDTPESASTMYIVPIIFDRNSQDVNALVRTTDIFWCGAGLSGCYQGSAIQIPTSVYSLPMTLAGQANGWDTGPESIGEDMHMYLKCYFATKGHMHTKVVYAPASQTNVSSGKKGFRGEIGTLRARYKQAMRHMWGSLDTGYAAQKFIEASLESLGIKSTSWLSTPDPHERVPLWVDVSTHQFTPPNVYEPHDQHNTSFDKVKLMVLAHRLFEAHFLPAHMTIALFSGIIFSIFVPNSIIHPWLLWSFGFNGTLRFIGLMFVNLYLVLYEGYHKYACRSREEEMKRAGLWDGMTFSYRSWRTNWLDYAMMPLTGTIFGTLPATVAEACHFYTDRLTYTVSAKPQIKRMLAQVQDAVSTAATTTTTTTLSGDQENAANV